MAKRAVVTGGAGFVGSHLCERLAREGYEVISLDNYRTGSPANHVPGVEYRRGSTHDIDFHISERPDIIFHLGEYARVEQSFADIEEVWSTNITGTHAVLEYWRKHGCKLVYAGSSTKFADNGLGKTQSPYAWTKAANTELVKLYSDWFSLPYAITYFYNVYGPRERGDDQSGTLIGIYRNRILEKQPLPVRLPGTQKRNFTHVYDIVEGIFRVGEHGEGDEYGLGHDDQYSVLEVAEMFGGEVLLIPGRRGNRQNGGVDSRRAHEELRWQPIYSLPKYIQELKFERDQASA